MEYGLQIRREAMMLCREQEYGFQLASWSTYQNQEHRMNHWDTLLSIANNRSESVSEKTLKRMEQMEKQIAQFVIYREKCPQQCEMS